MARKGLSLGHPGVVRWRLAPPTTSDRRWRRRQREVTTSWGDPESVPDRTYKRAWRDFARAPGTTLLAASNGEFDVENETYALTELGLKR